MNLTESISNIFKGLKRKNSLVQNISIVFSGNVFSILLQLTFAPILSRIFSPQAYGEYALYNLIISNITFFSALSLPSVYVLPKEEYKFLALSKVVFLNAIAVSLLSFFTYFLFKPLFDFEVSITEIVGIFGVLLITVINTTQSHWNIRKKRFLKNTKMRAACSFIGKSGTVGIGKYLAPNGFGLLLGNFISGFLALFLTLKRQQLIVLFRYYSRGNWKELISTLKENVNVIKYIFPARLITKFSSDLPIIAIGALMGVQHLGHYTFALTFINMPIQLFENSISPVVFQKANELYLTSRTAFEDFFVKSFKHTVFISLVPLTVLSLIAPSVFEFVFGTEWKDAGYVASLLSTKYIITTVLAPYASFWRIMKRERRLFALTTASFIFRNGPLLLLFLDIGFFRFLYLYSIISSIAPLINLTDLLYAVLPRRRASKIWTITILLILLSFIIIGLNSYQIIFENAR